MLVFRRTEGYARQGEKMPAPQNVHAADAHEAFAQYLKRGLLPANTEELQRLSVALYRLLGVTRLPSSSRLN